MDNEFVHWDDINLDDALGEDNWTDNDEILGAESEWGSSASEKNEDDSIDIVTSTQQDDSSTNSSAEKENVAPTKKMYKCPLCMKEYKSASGFRGHVAKKHNRPDLKAHQHMTASTPSITLPKKAVPLTNKDDLEKEMPQIVRRAVETVSNDPFLRLSSCQHGPTILKIATVVASQITILSVIVMTYLGPIFLNNASPAKIIPELHRLRINANFCSEFFDFIFAHIEPVNLHITNLFLQQFMTAMASSFFKQRVTLLDNVIEADENKLSDNDMEVIYHICGYIIHALRKRYHRARVSALSLLELTNFLEQDGEADGALSKWTNRIDRGGLRRPATKLVSLTIQIEKWLRKIVNINNLDTDTLVKLRATLLEYQLLKAAWGHVIKTENDRKWVLLEHYLGVFLKVRGFAVTRLIRKQMQKKRKLSKGVAGTRKALRKELKQISSV